MFSKTALQLLTTCALIGLLTAYWFWDASQFPKGNNLDLSQTSFLPIYCDINSDRASDTRQSAAVYFWNGKIRIDLKVVSLDKQPISAHEFVTAAKTGYLWRDDRGYGTLSNSVSDYPLLSGIAPSSEWFCFPYVFFDPSKFQIPGNITFQ
jgi:hypothetical protein